MKLPPFLLDQWIAQKHSANPPIEYDLASSTGPVWTLRELMALAGGDKIEQLLDTSIFYTAAAGTAELRSAIAALEGVDPSEVLVVTGGSEALLILFFLAAEPGANVLLPHPGFPSNTAIAESLGLEIRYYRLRAEDGFGVDLDEVQKLADRNTQMLLVNSPHNPSGAVLTDGEIDRLHDFCVERGIQFVADQVYHPIYHGPAMRSAARLPHATVLGDFSKALCLSGLRLGWIVDHNPERRERYLNARNYFTVTNNVFGERLAVIALKHSDAIYGRARAIATQNLGLLEQVMTEHTEIVRWHRPRGGMTAFPWLTNGGNAREFCRSLAKSGVLIVPGDCFGEPSHFRLGFAASGRQFPRGLERFADFLRKESRQRVRATAS